MYRKDSEGWLKHADFMVLDMICLQLAFILAYALRAGEPACGIGAHLRCAGRYRRAVPHTNLYRSAGMRREEST